MQCTIRLSIPATFYSTIYLLFPQIFLLYGISGVDDVIRYFIRIFSKRKYFSNEMRNLPNEKAILLYLKVVLNKIRIGIDNFCVLRLVSTKENFPQYRNGQESFLCVRAISSDRELTRQRSLSGNKSYSEWKPVFTATLTSYHWYL